MEMQIVLMGTNTKAAYITKRFDSIKENDNALEHVVLSLQVSKSCSAQQEQYPSDLPPYTH